MTALIKIADIIEIRKDRPMVRHCGYVYIIEFRPMYIKIGMSQDPAKRIAYLADINRSPISRSWVSPACYNYKNNEEALLKRFEKNVAFGEYFNMDFDEACLAAQGLVYRAPTEEEIASLNARDEMSRRKIHEKMDGWLMKAARDKEKQDRETYQEEVAQQRTRLSVHDASKVMGVSADDILVTIGMSYEDFLSFGPLIESDEGILLNNMHLSFLVMLLPTTDRILPLKVIAAKRLASTYHDEALGIVGKDIYS